MIKWGDPDHDVLTFSLLTSNYNHVNYNHVIMSQLANINRLI